MGAKMVTKTDYESMTDQELDRLSAERFCEIEGIFIHYGKEFNELMHKSKWHPTHPDSNQCERWLFPKLHGSGLTISLYLDDLSKTKICYSVLIEKYKIFSIQIECYEFDKINRTKVIACLMAWDKLNE